MKSVNYPKLKEPLIKHRRIEDLMNSFIKNIPTMSIDKIEE